MQWNSVFRRARSLLFSSCSKFGLWALFSRHIQNICSFSRTSKPSEKRGDYLMVT